MSEGKGVHLLVVEVMDGLGVLETERGTGVQEVVTAPSDGAVVVCVVLEPFGERSGCLGLVNLIVEEGSVHVSRDILDDTLLCAVLLMQARSDGRAEVEELFADSHKGDCVFAVHYLTTITPLMAVNMRGRGVTVTVLGAVGLLPGTLRYMSERIEFTK